MSPKNIFVLEKLNDNYDFHRLSRVFDSKDFKILTLNYILLEENTINKDSIKKFADFLIIPRNIEDLNLLIRKEKKVNYIFFCDLSIFLVKKIHFFFREVNYSIYFFNNYPDIRNFSKKIISHIFHQLYYSFLKINPPKKVYICGNHFPFNRLYPRSHSTEIQYVDSIDYLNFEDNLRQHTSLEKYFVFLDDMYPIHPDLNGKNIIDPVYYYSKINNLLKSIKKQFKIDCIVSAHPRASKGYEDNYNFKVYFNSTSSLIKNCEFVVGHSTTSYSYALFNFKPINIVMFKSQKNNYTKLAKRFSKEFGSNFNIVEEINDFKISKVDKKKYLEYINKYHSINF